MLFRLSLYCKFITTINFFIYNFILSYLYFLKPYSKIYLINKGSLKTKLLCQLFSLNGPIIALILQCTYFSGPVGNLHIAVETVCLKHYVREKLHFDLSHTDQCSNSIFMNCSVLLNWFQECSCPCYKDLATEVPEVVWKKLY